MSDGFFEVFEIATGAVVARTDDEQEAQRLATQNVNLAYEEMKIKGEVMHYLVVEVEGFTALSAIVADLHAHPSVRKIHIVDEDRVDNLRILVLGADPTHDRDQNHSTL